MTLLPTRIAFALALALSALASALPACEPAAESTDPSIVNLQVVDAPFAVGVAANLSGSLGVSDPDGDLATLHLAMFRPDGSPFGTLEVPIDGAAGQTTGTLPFSFEFTADTVGRYSLEAWVVDAAGQASNHLVATTSEVTTLDATPSLANLQATLPDVRVGLAATLAGNVDFADGDGNLTTLVVRVKRFDTTVAAEARVPVNSPAGTLTGTAPFSIDFTADAAGTHTLEIVAEDGDGLTSRAVTRSFTVTASATAPALRNFDIDDARAYIGIATALPIAFDFSDSDANVDTLFVRITDAAGTVRLEREEALALSGQASGSVATEVTFTAQAAGRYTIAVQLGDAAGERSNTSSLTFDAITASTTAPILSGLAVPAGSFYAGKLATLSGSVDFRDVDGNVVTLTLRLARPDGSTLSERLVTLSDVTDETEGTIAFELAFTPTNLGLHTLHVSASDADGQASGEVTRLVDVVRSPTAPVASDLELPGARAYVDIATGLPVSLDFSDSDANVTTLHARILSPSGAVAALFESPLPNAAGDVSGSVASEVPLTAPIPGRYSIAVWLSDAAGETSNELTLTFDVTQAATTAPKAFGLEVLVVSAVAAKASALDGSLRFDDVDGNVTTLVLRMLRPDGSLLTEVRKAQVGVAGTMSGDIDFSLAFTPDRVGFHTLELWLEDADGQASARLTRGVSVESSPTAPVLAGLELAGGNALVAVATDITGSVDFADSDGNVATLHLRVTEPGGAERLAVTRDLATFAGDTAGTIPFSLAVTATLEGRHTLEVWVVDALGETSARQSRTFDALRTNTTPTLSTLSLELLPVLLGQAVSLTGSVAFADVDKDLATLFLRVVRPDGSVLVERQDAAGVSGQASGSVAVAVDFTADHPGRHTLALWVQDAAGQTSSQISRTFDVIDTRPVVKKVTAVHDPLFVTKASTIAGAVDFTDADGNAVVVKVQLVRPDGTTFPELAVALSDLASVTQASVPFTLTVTPDVKGSHTLAAWVEDADGQRAVTVTTPIAVGDTSNVASACAALGTDCTGQGFCYDVTSSTCDYFESHELTPPAVCEDVTSTGSQALCVASTTDPASPLVTDSNRCKFVQFWSYPTDFPIDCRCPEAHFDQRCIRPYFTSQATTFGSGPRIRALAGTIQPWRGVVHGREWLLPVKWSTAQRPNETMIFAIDLDTAARRHFSGAWESPTNGYTSVGSGDPFVQVMDLGHGPDGMLYAVGAASDIAAPKLWRIDPATGARTKIFDEETASASELCPNFSSLPGRKVVQMATQGWAMDGQGRFYFSNVGMPGPSILRLTVAGVGGATTTHCEYLTRVMDCPTCTTQQNVGGGYDAFQFDFTAFAIEAGKLYAVSDKRFVAVDLATGHRSLLSYANDVGAIGTGPINAEGLADRWTTWDPQRDVFWTVGILGGSMAVTVEPESGDRAAWPCFHTTRGVLEGCGGTGMPLVPGPLNFGGMVIDPLPPHDLYFAHDLFAIVKYEVKTGNSYTFSL